MSSYCLVGGHRVLVGGPELCSGVGIWLWESLKYRHEVVTDHKQWEPLKYRHEVINLLSSFLNPPPPPTSPFYGLHFSLPPPPPCQPLTILPPLHLSYHFPLPLKYRHEVINLLSSFLPPPPPTSPFYGLHFSLPPPPPHLLPRQPLIPFSLPSTSLTIFLPHPHPPPLSYHSTLVGGGGGSKISI